MNLWWLFLTPLWEPALLVPVNEISVVNGFELVEREIPISASSMGSELLTKSQEWGKTDFNQFQKNILSNIAMSIYASAKINS